MDQDQLWMQRYNRKKLLLDNFKNLNNIKIKLHYFGNYIKLLSN
jgi:hypothetical protein